MIKAVVFDYGGVISFLPPHEAKVKLEQLTGLSDKMLAELNRKYRGEWDRGTYDGMGYYRFILSEMGVFLDDDSLIQVAQADTEGWKNINPAAVQLMEEVKNAGLCLGILSNMPRDFLAWVRGAVPVIRKADVSVFSCEHHTIKPEQAIYEKLREQLGCEYAEIVFFDDIADNIAMAKKLGIQAFLWEGPNAARAQMIKMEMGLGVS
jgi:HAD superfamily hydrolase (TIGR01509 family)